MRSRRQAYRTKQLTMGAGKQKFTDAHIPVAVPSDAQQHEPAPHWSLPVHPLPSASLATQLPALQNCVGVHWSSVVHPLGPVVPVGPVEPPVGPVGPVAPVGPV